MIRDTNIEGTIAGVPGALPDYRGPTQSPREGGGQLKHNTQREV